MILSKKNTLKSVYIFGTMDDVIKIGISQDADARKRRLELSSGRTFTKVWVSPPTPNALKIERLIHAKYGRHRKQGEWFDGLSFDTVLEHVSRYDYSNQLGIF